MNVDEAEEKVQSPVRAEAQIRMRFGAFLALAVIINLVSWPTLFSLDLWVLKDRGSFLNLDYLLDQHIRLGVDTFYCYGLLPVFIQHWLFVWFGRGYWPLIGCAAASTLLIAYACALILRYLPREILWFVALLLMSRILNTVNPNLPYSLVQISLLFALFFVLANRFDLALAATAVGCWSVPSLPLVMALSLSAVIAVDWYLHPPRKLRSLVLAFLPGGLTYFALGSALMIQFGWQSVMATATPIAGMAFYRKVGYGSSQALMEFLHPPGYAAMHYLTYVFLNPVVWWVTSSLLLIWFAIRALQTVIRQRRLEPKSTAIILCALIQVALTTVAYGAPHQHYIYDPIMIVGVLLGLAQFTKSSSRRLLIAAFLVLGVVGQASLLRATLKGWKQIRTSDTAHLYADLGWASEWKQIVELSATKNVLMLSYSTGVHHYFPSIHSPEVWTVREGQFLPQDNERVDHQIDQADLVVLDMTSPVDFDFLKPGAPLTSFFCLTRSTPNFQFWSRRSLLGAGEECLPSGTSGHEPAVPLI